MKRNIVQGKKKQQIRLPEPLLFWMSACHLLQSMGQYNLCGILSQSGPSLERY